MLEQLTHVQVWVHDQDEALAFYTEKLGMELREDVTVPEMGNFRWLSVGIPGQDSLDHADGDSRRRRHRVDEETREQIQKLTGQRGASGGLFFATGDGAAAATSELEEPWRASSRRSRRSSRSGIDAGFRGRVRGNHCSGWRSGLRGDRWLCRSSRGRRHRIPQYVGTLAQTAFFGARTAAAQASTFFAPADRGAAKNGRSWIRTTDLRLIRAAL